MISNNNFYLTISFLSVRTACQGSSYCDLSKMQFQASGYALMPFMLCLAQMYVIRNI